MTRQAADFAAVAETGRRVLQTEAEALLALGRALPEDFEAAAQLLAALEGRVIVSGIGKSGHIGRKISATLASTGTPSYFVHASEASHGDLGMITRHDVCLLISNSGETAELRDILLHTRRFSIPMIGISSNPNSTLMQAADFELTLPKLPELLLKRRQLELLLNRKLFVWLLNRKLFVWLLNKRRLELLLNKNLRSQWKNLM